MAKKKSLGRGLSELLGEIESTYESRNLPFRELDINLIKTNPFQPRRNFDQKSLGELSISIKEYGLLQPVVVIPKDNEFILVAGERRLKASKIAQLSHIKAYVSEIDFGALAKLAVVENIQREDLNALELAMAYEQILNQEKITHEALAQLLHKSRSQITNTLRLLDLCGFAKECLMNQTLSMGHCKILVGLKEDVQEQISKEIIEEKLTVAQAELKVQKLKKGKEKNVKPHITVPSLDFSPFKRIFKKIPHNVAFKRNSFTVTFKDNNEIEDFMKHFIKS